MNAIMAILAATAKRTGNRIHFVIWWENNNPNQNRSKKTARTIAT